MRAVIQRVTKASVTINGSPVGSINTGLVIFLAVHSNDTEEVIPKLADKIAKLRIFEDGEQKMNLSITDIKGELLVVSQFTLYGDCQKGNRLSFIQAAPPEKAKRFYDMLVEELEKTNLKVETGQFREYMKVELINNGPTTIIIDM